jgi:predicted transcriptional regulator
MAKRKTLGVYLNENETARLEAIVDELGVSAHSLMKWAMLDFIARFEAGDVRPTVEEQKQMVIVFPDDETDES